MPRTGGLARRSLTGARTNDDTKEIADLQEEQGRDRNDDACNKGCTKAESGEERCYAEDSGADKDRANLEAKTENKPEGNRDKSYRNKITIGESNICNLKIELIDQHTTRFACIRPPKL